MRYSLGSGPTRRWIKLAQYAFIVIGLSALGYCLAVIVSAKHYQAMQARNFAREIHVKAAAGPADSHVAATVVAPENGEVVGRLEIPRIGVSVMVVEGADHRDLERAVGHIPGTALPGEPGNVGIAGHRDTFFRPLRDVRRGDAITFRTLQRAYHYRVVSTEVVRPEDVQVLSPTGRDCLTLVTCFPFHYLGPAPKRFIVRAGLMPGT